VPPHNLAAEESLLGAMLLSRDAISAASMECQAEDFYKPAHGHIFEAILRLHGQGEPADPVTVADELRRADLLDAIGGPAVLVTLQANTPATSNAASYAKIVTEHSLLRRLIGVAAEIAELGYSVPEDVTEAIDRAESMVFEVADRRVTDTTKVLSELLYASLERIEALFDKGQDITGVPTGYTDIDERLSGLQPSTLVIVGARPAMGKAQPVDTPVVTPAGWRPLGELAVGDEVIGSDGRPTRVTGVFPQGVRPVFRVELDDRTSTRTCAEHLWRVFGDYDLLLDGAGRVVDTRPIAAELEAGDRHHHVPVVGPVLHPVRRLPADAYLTGLLLAGRTGDPSTFTVPDAELLAAVEGLLPFGATAKAESRDPLRVELAGLGPVGPGIPEAYLRAGVAQRLALLQGLMDAAGCYDHGCARFRTDSAQLAAGTAELVRGLGGVARVTARRSAGRVSHQLVVTMPDGLCPFRLQARRDLWTDDTERQAPRRTIVAVTADGTAPCVCIAVEAADRLYCTEQHIVTHNTAFALGMAAHAAVQRKVPVLFFSLEMGHLEITQRLLCAEAQVDSNRLRNGRLLDSDWPRITSATSRLGEAPLYVDDNPNVTVMEVRAKARRLKSRLGGLGLIVVDYLQLMTGRHNAESRQVEIAEMSRGLKILARELEVPVVALSQLSRNLEGRQDKKPMLSDLRESGCLTGDARVLRADTGAEVTLGELLVTGERDIPVWTVGRDHRLVVRTMTHVFPSGIKPVFALHLASGRTVKASANHPFLTMDGWARLDQLEVGGRVAVPAAVPAPVKARSWPRFKLVLLAHLLGDASGTLRQPLQCRTADPAVVRAVREAASRLGFVAEWHRQGNWSSVQLSPDHPSQPDPIGAWLDTLGLTGLRSRETFVPAPVLQLPDDDVAVFLRHLWASGGSLGWRAGRAELALVTASRRLADDVQLLLLRFGIQARVGEAAPDHRGASGWQVTVDSAAAQRTFLDRIGAFGGHVRRVPLLLAKLPAEAARAAESVPLRRDPLLGPTIGAVRAGVGVVTVASAPAAAARLLHGDLAWDRIVAIDPLGDEPVYDATVEDTHNFIANGIAVHNSLEQDADVVMFIYRDEIYNPETNDKGVAEIIVAKHRNGPTGTAKLVFQDRFTRFDNAARGV
jgi:replicative DNA helicase